MIGIGTPNSHSNIPRPMARSPFVTQQGTLGVNDSDLPLFPTVDNQKCSSYQIAYRMAKLSLMRAVAFLS